MNVKDVTNENFEEEVLKSKTKVLVDFNATWCGPCQMLKPIIEQLSEEMDNVKFVSINVDEQHDLNHKYNVSAIPCLIMFNKGVEEKRTVGFTSKDDLKKWVED